MRTRRRNPHFHEPSLVPMADMLTNTVGVVLFILIFTVLTAGGAILPKQLPMERHTKAKPMFFLCAFGRIQPLDAEAVVEEFVRPLKNGNPATIIERFRNRRLDIDGFTVTGEVRGSFLVDIEPTSRLGESTPELSAPASKYRARLAAAKADEYYADFFVYPDGMTSFRAARKIASEAGFGTGWVVFGADKPIRFCVGGNCSGSRQGTVQD